MSLPVRLLPEARTEYGEAAVWYEQQRAGLGANFTARVEAVFNRIAANPKLHAKVYGDVRKAVVRKFPYIVLYQEERAGGSAGHLGVPHRPRPGGVAIPGAIEP